MEGNSQQLACRRLPVMPMGEKPKVPRGGLATRLLLGASAHRSSSSSPSSTSNGISSAPAPVVSAAMVSAAATTKVSEVSSDVPRASIGSFSAQVVGKTGVQSVGLVMPRVATATLQTSKYSSEPQAPHGTTSECDLPRLASEPRPPMRCSDAHIPGAQDAHSAEFDSPTSCCAVPACAAPSRMEASKFGSEQLRGCQGQSASQVAHRSTSQADSDLPPLPLEPKAPDRPKPGCARTASEHRGGKAASLPGVVSSAVEQRPGSVSPASMELATSTRAAARRLADHHDPCSQRAAGHQESVRGQVRAVRKLAEHYRWCAIDATAQQSKESSVEHSGGDGIPQELLAEPRQFSVVLVLFEVCTLQVAGRMAQHIREALQGLQENPPSGAPPGGLPSPPVVAVLLGAAGGTSPGGFDERLAVEVQLEMLSRGVDDVIAKSGTDADLGVAVAMARARAVAKRRQREQSEREVRRRVQRVLEGEDPRHGMFWESVHHLFSQFPAMDADLAHDPGAGDELGHLRLVKKLGGGSCGTVFSAMHTETGKLEAVKMIDKTLLTDLDKVNFLWRECKVLRRLNHENIVKYYGCMHGPTHLFIRMEMVGRMNLCQVLKKKRQGMGLGPAQRYMAQIASSVLHLHERGVAHRDLKPENLAITEDGTLIKVLDFGSVTPLDKECSDMAGTMPFMAPEVLVADDKEPYNPSGCDVWASAIVLLEMLCGLGKFEKMLGWECSERPCPEKAKELQAFFTHTDAISRALEEDLGSPDHTLLALLEGMLHLGLTARWSAQQTWESAWLQGAHQHS